MATTNMSVTAANLLSRLNGALDSVSNIGHIGQKAGLWDVNLPHTAEEKDFVKKAHG